MALTKTAAFLQSRVEVKIRTCHSTIYVNKAEPNVVWKAESIWVDGTAYGKSPLAEDTSGQLRREHAIYQALGDHPRITKCLGIVEDDKTGDAIALRFELAPRGDLRCLIRDTAPPFPPPQRVAIAAAFAEGVVHLHSRGVTWGDLSTRNLLVFEDDALKLCDFASSALEGVYPEFGPHTYEQRYWPALPNNEVCQQLSMLQRELYALGSAIYEITEWKKPYADNSDVEVTDIVESGQRPTLSDENVARDIITRCWDLGYASAKDVWNDLAVLSRRLDNGDAEALME